MKSDEEDSTRISSSFEISISSGRSSWRSSSSISISSRFGSLRFSSSKSKLISSFVSEIAPKASSDIFSPIGSSSKLSSKGSSTAVSCGSSGSITDSSIAVSSSTLASSVSSLKSAVFKMLESSSVERAIVSSPSSPEKKPVSSLESSSITGSSTAISSEIMPCDSAAGAGAAFISSRLFFNVLISSLRLERSATICLRSELSTLETAGSSEVISSDISSGSAASSTIPALISFTTGAAFILPSPTERS